MATMNTALKALCLLCYALALASLAGLLPEGTFTRTPWLAGALLLIHAVEAVLFRKHLRLYRGTLAGSVVLTLLFGVLHWKPLVDAQKRQHQSQP
jgi:uncharacterized protein YhhL (DUF1145 family)